MRPLIPLILLVLVLLAGCLDGGEQVKVNDTVKIDYVGKLSDGRVFDTSRQSVAEDESIPKTQMFQKRDIYEPLEFTVGAKQVIPGFDNGVVGLKVGQKKTITIPPEEAYGLDDPTMIDTWRKIWELPVEESIEVSRSVDLATFTGNFQEEPVVGERYPLDNGINITVTGVGEENVTFEFDLYEGDIVTDPMGLWNDSVIARNETHFTVRHLVEAGEVYEEFGYPWVIKITEVGENFTSVRTLKEGTTSVMTFLGPREVRENETHIIIDFNHPLAGETLIFDVEVVEINSTSSEAGS